jgi:hypothetical protein
LDSLVTTTDAVFSSEEGKGRNEEEGGVDEEKGGSVMLLGAVSKAGW